MAVEDVAALSECLTHVKHDSDEPSTSSSTSLRSALDVFERTRQPRTKEVQEASLEAGNKVHLPDGSEQEVRDAAMLSDADGETINPSAYALMDVRARDRWYSYDAVQAVKDVWAQTVGGTDGEV